jgi:hypothetical protein
MSMIPVLFVVYGARRVSCKIPESMYGRWVAAGPNDVQDGGALFDGAPFLDGRNTQRHIERLLHLGAIRLPSDESRNGDMWWFS